MKRLMKGNEAIVEAAIHAGCKAFFGYPITPQNEIPEYMSQKFEEAGGIYIQAESEVAAINMVYGAAATGARVMTSSSSPGIALKQEGISYLVGANLPCVIVAVTRSGPGLGGILPSQSDYFQITRGGGNGDYYLPVYAPDTAQEATDLVQKAFNTADKYRTPVMVVVDGLLGQMMEPVEIRDVPVEPVEKPWVADGNSKERGHTNIVSSLSLVGDVLEVMNEERFKVYDEIIEKETMVQDLVEEGDEVAVVAYGSAGRIAYNAIEDLKAEGIKAGIVRLITLWPFPEKTLQNLPKSVKHILVCELSKGQMIQDVKLAVGDKYPIHFYGRCGGMIFEPCEIADKIRKIVKGEC